MATTTGRTVIKNKSEIYLDDIELLGLTSISAEMEREERDLTTIKDKEKVIDYITQSTAINVEGIFYIDNTVHLELFNEILVNNNLDYTVEVDYYVAGKSNSDVLPPISFKAAPSFSIDVDTEKPTFSLELKKTI